MTSAEMEEALKRMARLLARRGCDACGGTGDSDPRDDFTPCECIGENDCGAGSVEVGRRGYAFAAQSLETAMREILDSTCSDCGVEHNAIRDGRLVLIVDGLCAPCSRAK